MSRTNIFLRRLQFYFQTASTMLKEKRLYFSVHSGKMMAVTRTAVAYHSDLVSKYFFSFAKRLRVGCSVCVTRICKVVKQT